MQGGILPALRQPPSNRGRDAPLATRNDARDVVGLRLWLVHRPRRNDQDARVILLIQVASPAAALAARAPLRRSAVSLIAVWRGPGRRCPCNFRREHHIIGGVRRRYEAGNFRAERDTFQFGTRNDSYLLRFVQKQQPRAAYIYTSTG